MVTLGHNIAPIEALVWLVDHLHKKGAGFYVPAGWTASNGYSKTPVTRWLAEVIIGKQLTPLPGLSKMM